jgi:hypothetical protein
MATTIQPLDPNSPKGREIAAELSQVLAEIFVELDAKKAAKARAATAEREAA